MYTNAIPFLEIMILGNSVGNIIFSFVLFFVLFWILRIFRKIILIKLSSWVKNTETDIDDEILSVISNVSPLFYWVIAFFIATQKLVLSPWIGNLIHGIFIVIIVYEIIKATQNILNYILQKVIADKDSTALAGINLIIRIVLWSIGLLMILSNLGINVSALIASMGIGGIAIALAAQNILSDLFSSFSIYFDKPFQIGDYIVVGTDNGIVKKIGLKTTRIQTLQGEELVIGNKELTNVRVQNFKKLKDRRVVFHFGVTYDTKPETLRTIPQIIKDIINSKELTECDRVVFTKFADSSLDFEVVYYVHSKEYNDYAHVQHDINIDIKQIFDEKGISMAFPTRTIHLEQTT